MVSNGRRQEIYMFANLTLFFFADDTQAPFYHTQTPTSCDVTTCHDLWSPREKKKRYTNDTHFVLYLIFTFHHSDQQHTLLPSLLVHPDITHSPLLTPRLITIPLQDTTRDPPTWVMCVVMVIRKLGENCIETKVDLSEILRHIIVSVLRRPRG